MRALLRTSPTRHLLLQPARPRPTPPRQLHPRGRPMALRHPSPRALRPHACGTPQYTSCCKRSTLAHHALLQHHDAPLRRRRRRKFPHPTWKGARAFGPPRHATQRSRKIAMPACCKCHRVQALVKPRTVPARTTAQPTNEPQCLASPSQARAHPASKRTKPEQPAK